MSFKDKIKTMMGIDEEEYEMDDFEEEFEEPEVVKPAPSKPDLTVVTNPTTSVNQSTNKGKSTVMQMNTEANKLKLDSNLNKVIIREPNEYSDAQDIADCLKENYPVFINLQRLEKSQAKRVVDFLSGTIYAIDGDIKRVGTNLFLCTPKTVETEGQVTMNEVQPEIEE
ncbi:cell division protein SepF [Turicibacter sp. TJ11]|uniref:cell division protein SepF n=1 Tax=Turicibacter sp. TJ11 TaxID=2806443 RepID=UPI001F1AB11C|nr:cell division protein SepF [Turicibacter sp. TJ11]